MSCRNTPYMVLYRLRRSSSHAFCAAGSSGTGGRSGVTGSGRRSVTTLRLLSGHSARCTLLTFHVLPRPHLGLLHVPHGTNQEFQQGAVGGDGIASERSPVARQGAYKVLRSTAAQQVRKGRPSDGLPPPRRFRVLDIPDQELRGFWIEPEQVRPDFRLWIRHRKQWRLVVGVHPGHLLGTLRKQWILSQQPRQH